MSPIQEQMDLPIKSKNELTRKGMYEIYLNAKGKGAEEIKKIRENYRKKMENAKQERIKELATKEKNYQEGDGNDYEEYLKMENIKILWGPAYYPLLGQYRRDTDTAETVKVYFGSDFKWYVGEKIVSDEYALELIENDETREDYEKIIKRIEELKNNLK